MWPQKEMSTSVQTFPLPYPLLYKRSLGRLIWQERRLWKDKWKGTLLHLGGILYHFLFIWRENFNEFRRSSCLKDKKKKLEADQHLLKERILGKITLISCFHYHLLFFSFLMLILEIVCWLGVDIGGHTLDCWFLFVIHVFFFCCSSLDSMRLLKNCFN